MSFSNIPEKFRPSFESMDALLSFANRAHGNHDKAHDLLHALRVHHNSLKIVIGERLDLTLYEWKELPYVMIGHDFLDHKQHTLTVNEWDVLAFYESVLGATSAQRVLDIQKASSWSKRETEWSRGTLMKVLQDADWLDALGEVGLKRCVDFSVAKGVVDVPSNVCKHIYEKLLLIPDALNYETSKKMVEKEKLLEPLYDYLKKHKYVLGD